MTADTPKVSTREEWLTARRELLAREEQHNKEREALCEARRALPMVKMDKEYVLEGPDGKATLADLFDGRRQLIIYHFMFVPEWENGCSFCTGFTDDLGKPSHLHDQDTTMVLVSRAPLESITRYKEKRGWTMPWYSSYGTDFNYDFHVTLDEDVAPLELNFRSKAEHEREVGPWDMWGPELPGVSVFVRGEDGEVYHTYSTYTSGPDTLVSSLNLLDLTPSGR